MDETFIGGEEPGLRGGRAKGKKSLVGVAVEVSQPRGYGRCRMAILADASAASLHPFVTGHVEPGATVITDAWQGYRGIEGLGYTHDRRSQRAARARGDDPGKLLPGVHRVASLAKRWLLGTHQGSVEDTTCRATWTSSPSASTAADPAAAGWSSTASSSSPSATPRCATATSSPTRSPRRSHPPRRPSGATHRAWTARERPDPGEPPTWHSPVS